MEIALHNAATLTLSHGASADWYSSDLAIAGVDAIGNGRSARITARAIGECVVAAVTADGQTASEPIKVTGPAIRLGQLRLVSEGPP